MAFMDMFRTPNMLTQPQQGQNNMLTGIQKFSQSPFGQNLQNAMLGWAQGGTVQDSLGKGAMAVALGRRQREGDAERNQTLNFLRSKGMDDQTAQAAISNPAVLTDVLKGMIQGQDPMKALELERAQLEVNNLRNPTTDDIKEYQVAKNQGYGGTLQDWIVEGKKAGATSVTVGGGKYGTIPQGYELRETPEGAQLVPIPGGPEDTSKKDALRSDQASITSDTVINAARKAREAVRSGALPTTGTLGKMASSIGESGAAEVNRQVASLRATAAAENLNAMRQASPTGGALGNASDADIKLLQDKAGAIDPSAGEKRFLEQLDDYERTLLRIVHGKEAGDAIFQQSRKSGSNANKPLSEMTDEELEAIANGQQ